MTARIAVLMTLVACATEPDVETTEQAVTVTWQNAVGVSAVGNDLTKTAAQSTWAAGASSLVTFAGDGGIRFTTGEATTAKMVGLDTDDNNRGYVELGFALYLTATGKVYVYEGGVNRGQVGTYAAGDAFVIQVIDNVVTYEQNGVELYTSGALHSGFPLRVDTSLYTPGATIQDVELISYLITWQNASGVVLFGNSMDKAASQDTWAAGASSVETLSGDGSVVFRTDEGTSKMVGLSVGDANRGYTEIDYALYLTQAGKLYVYENGVNRGQVGTYAGGDTFRIDVAGSAVSYRKNSALLYTSTVAPSFPLRVDTSLKTPGASIIDVRLTPGGQTCQAYTGGPSVCTGNFTVGTPADIAAIAGCRRITGNLTFLGKVLTDVELPNLRRVDGQIQALEPLASLRLPALREVGGTLRLLEPLPTIEIPALRTAGTIWSDHALTAPCLESVSPGFAFIPGLTAPRLRAVGSHLQTGGTLPALETVGGELLGNIVAPALTTVGGGVSGTITAPALTDVGGVLDYTDQIDVPAVQRVGTLYLRTALTRIDLDALTDVAQLVGEGSNVGADECGASLPVDLDLPALTTAGSIALCTELGVSLPALEQIGSGQVAAFFVGPEPATPPLSLPALTTVRGGMRVHAALDAPALALITGTATIVAPLTAPALTEIRGALDVRTLTFTSSSLVTIRGVLNLDNAPVTAVSLPGLTSVGGILARSANALTDLDLPALAAITDTGTGQFSGQLWVRETQLSTFTLPALTSLAGDLTITNNADLPACYATDLVAQLQAAGWMGMATIFGNNGSGTCP